MIETAQTAHERVADMMLGTLTAARDEKQRTRANLVNEIEICESDLTQRQAALNEQKEKLTELDAEISEIKTQIDVLNKAKARAAGQ